MQNSWELRAGAWQDALADVQQVDALILDAPYGARTHGGHDGAPTVGGFRVSAYDPRYHTSAGRPSPGVTPCVRRAIHYAAWTEQDVRALVASWVPRTRGWIVSITDHNLAPIWAQALEDAGRYVFAPLPWVAPGSRVRLSGDGPSSWTCWIVVARPRTGAHRDGTAWHKWGTLPGAYIVNQQRGQAVVGAKPIGLMRALVRDYTRPGDLVCDPCAGGGTTGRACQLEGRRFIGAELDTETHAAAVQRLSQPYTCSLLQPAPVPVQASLLE